MLWFHLQEASRIGKIHRDRKYIGGCREGEQGDTNEYWLYFLDAKTLWELGRGGGIQHHECIK